MSEQRRGWNHSRNGFTRPYPRFRRTIWHDLLWCVVAIVAICTIVVVSVRRCDRPGGTEVIWDVRPEAETPLPVIVPRLDGEFISPDSIDEHNGRKQLAAKDGAPCRR